MKKLALGQGGFSIPIKSKLVKGFTSKDIRLALERYMAEDVMFNRTIKRHLISRLKIATGKLWDSIQFNTNVKISKTSGVFNVKISVFLADPKLIDALLGKDELEMYGNNEIPSISELEEYVKAKKSMFTEKIAEKRRAAARSTQRELLAQNPKHGMKKAGSETSAKYLKFKNDPIESIANEIQQAMIARQEDGLPPTRGSTSVFMGYWEIKHEDTGKKFTKPRYRDVHPALYTIKNDSGVINQAVLEMLDRFYNTVFAPGVIDGIDGVSSDMNLNKRLELEFGEIYEEESVARELKKIQERLAKLYRDAKALESKDISHWSSAQQKKQSERLAAIESHRLKWENIARNAYSGDIGTKIRKDVHYNAQQFRKLVQRFAVNIRRRRLKRRRGI